MIDGEAGRSFLLRQVKLKIALLSLKHMIIYIM
jgi:hypothetical protein